MKKLLPIFILMFAGVGFAQSDLPEIGKLDDIKGKTKFYLAADAVNTKWIMKQFKNDKAIVQVNRVEDAEFIIEFTTINRGEKASLYASPSYEEGEMNVYFYRENRKKVIAWRDSAKTGWGTPSQQLVKRFLKAFGARK